MTNDHASTALELARRTWPSAKIARARKWHTCDNNVCRGMIQPGDAYINPGESNPDSAGGFGGFRYCLRCAGGDPL